jgi:hypothetical protein
MHNLVKRVKDLSIYYQFSARTYLNLHLRTRATLGSRRMLAARVTHKLSAEIDLQPITATCTLRTTSSLTTITSAQSSSSATKPSTSTKACRQIKVGNKVFNVVEPACTPESRNHDLSCGYSISTSRPKRYRSNCDDLTPNLDGKKRAARMFCVSDLQRWRSES